MSPTASLNPGVHPDALEALAAETPEEETHYREALKKNGQPVMRDGQALMLAYVNARFVQDRLDSVVGPHNWQTNFIDVVPGESVRCSLGIRVDGEWVWKSDVGVASSIEPEKGSHSDAFKRAAVHWGIARDLYDERDDREDPAPPAPIRQRIGVDDPESYNDEREAYDQRDPNPRYAPRASRAPVRAAPPRQYREDGPDWDCPIHGESKVVPAGVSQRTGKAYNAFFACPVAGCDEKGPSLPNARR